MNYLDRKKRSKNPQQIISKTTHIVHVKGEFITKIMSDHPTYRMVKCVHCNIKQCKTCFENMLQKVEYDVLALKCPACDKLMRVCYLTPLNTNK
jgi:hypothetical protein